MPADRQQVDHAGSCHDQAGRSNLEHAERRQAGLARHAIDEDVGGRADHGQRAAENGRVGQRNQQLRRRGAGALGQRNRHRREDCDHWRVVQAGGNHQRGDRQAEQYAGRAGADRSPSQVPRASIQPVRSSAAEMMNMQAIVTGAELDSTPSTSPGVSSWVASNTATAIATTISGLQLS